MAKNRNKQRREKRKKKARKNIVQNNGTNGTYGQKAFKQLDCHTGMTAVHYSDNGRALWIGGWKHGARFDADTFVIDLTGDEDKYNNAPRAYGKQAEALLKAISPTHGGWLSLPFPDYGIPKNMKTYKQWYDTAQGIKKILQGDKDVLVACLGGHGRSGLFCAIVGYILANGEGWESPVDKIRAIHCQMAVETDQQEQFVYDILGLDLIANPKDYHTGFSFHDDDWTSSSFSKCPICDTESMYIKTNGMCLKCQDAAKLTAPKVMDITVEMLNSVHCTCTNKNCLGTWVAEKCGHAIHDKLVIDGYCEHCCESNAKADNHTIEKVESAVSKMEVKCELCGTISAENAFWTGMCVGCGMQFENDETPTVHDTLTDNFTVLTHNCDHPETCKGICVADICKHAVHDRYVVDGLCPKCYNKREMTRIAQQNKEE